jgi:xylulokinase
MGPCVLLTDADHEPLRPAILYGVDTRSGRQIERLNERYGAEEIVRRCGSALSSQAAGAKVAWVADEEPELFASARRLYMPSSFLAAAATGLPEGIPVITGTIDAWSEALSVGAQGAGDLMLMYGTTMFLVHTVPEPLTSPALWGTVGALPGTRNLAGGMATSGAITGWLRELFGSDYGELLEEAAESGAGANGLLMLPYFAGERTPIMDPEARGVIAGLTLSHTRGDLYRAALEATGFAVRHNIEAIEAAGGDIRRIVAVGGGTQGGLWTQIVSDITGREQEIRAQSIGASYGAAWLAAQLVGPVSIDAWNPVRETVTPRPGPYEELYGLYRDLYPRTADTVHALAGRQER